MATNLKRRQLLKAALAGTVLPVLPTACASLATKSSQAALIGCALQTQGHYQAVVADRYGKKIRALPIPARGHGVAISNVNSHAVAFGRRPGTFMMVFDYLTGDVITLETAESTRHFYGHGVYSHDGQWLYATQGVRETSEGIIAVFDASNKYKKVAEFRGFGIGPHEVILKNNGQLVVGVGGVHTNGRMPLNLDSMKPSLTYLDGTQGTVIEQVGLDDHHLSIRHLAHDDGDTVLCGQQYRGEPDDYPSLIAMHKPGQPMQSLQAEPEQWARFNHYIASIAADEDWIVATSPPGNCYGVWSKHTQQLVELEALSDASGVVYDNGEFVISSGASRVINVTPPQQSIQSNVNVYWDNHWASI